MRLQAATFPVPESFDEVLQSLWNAGLYVRVNVALQSITLAGSVDQIAVGRRIVEDATATVHYEDDSDVRDNGPDQGPGSDMSSSAKPDQGHADEHGE